jgi:hypothetical protein
LADRPQAVTALSRIFLEEIEQLRCHAADVPTAVMPRNMPALGLARSRFSTGSVLRSTSMRICMLA